VPRHRQAARFHLVVQGRSHFFIEPDHSVELNAGDLILIPYGNPHIIANLPTKTAPQLETVLEEAGYTGEGFLILGDGETEQATQMVCGHLDFRINAEHPFINALPSYIVINSSIRAQNPLLDESLRMISRRIFKENFGSDAAIRRLSEIVFIELLRLGIGQQEELSPFLNALRDPRIGKSLDIIHSQATKPWNLNLLASEVAMSRSRFAERFKELVGVSPMSYLSEWRLQKALAMLGDTRKPIQQVAADTGYRSSSSFTRAFQEKFGMAPKDYREANSSLQH
jgi:AraC-like DNA-binding protein